MRGIPAGYPTVMKREPKCVARRASSEYVPPTGSTTTSAPPPVISFIRSFSGSRS